MTDWPKTLAEWSKACDASTAGPWGLSRRTIYVVDANGDPAPRTGMRPAGDPYPAIARMAADYEPDFRNAEFIALARTALPEAIARIRELEAYVWKCEAIAESTIEGATWEEAGSHLMSFVIKGMRERP